jgi:hypothetical protein
MRPAPAARGFVFQPDLAVVLAVDGRLNAADLFGHRCVGVELHLPFSGLAWAVVASARPSIRAKGHALHRYLQVLP